MIPQKCFVLVLFAVSFSQSEVSANWLYLGVLSAIQSSNLPPSGNYQQRDLSNSAISACRVPGLTPAQIQVCHSNPNAMQSVGKGARSSISECRWQFKNERWNCTTTTTANDSETDLYASTLKGANRETAFLSAITSAGLVYEVTKSCSAGNLSDCGCDMSYGRGSVSGNSKEKWSWSGCSDNVRYGIQFSKQFLDVADRERNQEEPTNPQPLMTLHNNQVGREVIAKLIQIQCRCHGVSGSCELKTCWRTLPPFKRIGEQLKQHYDLNAVQVAKKIKKRLKRKEKSERKVPIRKEQLVFLNKSPNYCIENPDYGILGTVGRECNRTSLGADSCDLLCCGRGYNTKVEKIEDNKCSCKFVWCCYVKCKTCIQNVDVNTCK